MKIILKGFDSYLMKFITYELLSSEKTQIIFKFSIFIKQKPELGWDLTDVY
jgi:hypothetical protein